MGKGARDNKHDPYQALKFRGFRNFLTMRVFVTVAVQIQAVILGWHIYTLTKDPLSLGFIGLAEAIPALSVALIAGYIADHYNRKWLLRISVLVMLVCSLILLIVTYPPIAETLSLKQSLFIFYTTIILIGFARGFYSPAAFSLISQLVPRSAFANSSTWNSSFWQASAIAGPAIGGLLYGFYGITVCFGLIALLHAGGVVLISFIYLLEKQTIPEKAENIIESLLQGIRFVFSTKMLLGALTLDLFSVFFGGAVALLPVFANDILNTGPQGLGLLRAAPSVGAVLSMLFFAYNTPMNKPWRNLLIGVTGFGISIILFGLSKNFYLSLFFLFLSGGFDSVSVIIRSTILQLLTPDDMRGRVSAVNTMFIGSSNEIGAFESGLAAKMLGVIPSVIFGGSMTLMIAGITWVKTKDLLKVRFSGK